MSYSSPTTVTTSNWEVSVSRVQTRVYKALAVKDARGGLSFQTYETPEEAQKDRLWRPGSKIVSVEVKEVGTVEAFELNQAQKDMIKMGLWELNEYGEMVRVQKEQTEA